MNEKFTLLDGLKGLGAILAAGVCGGVVLSIAATIVMFWMQSIVSWGWIK